MATPGAIRAAEVIVARLSGGYEGAEGLDQKERAIVADIIDRETHAPELRAALKGLLLEMAMQFAGHEFGEIGPPVLKAREILALTKGA